MSSDPTNERNGPPRLSRAIQGLLCALALGFLSAGAAEASISVLSSDRSVTESGTSFCGCPDDFSTFTNTVSDQVGTFQETASGVGSDSSQDSWVGAGGITGTGSAGGGFSAINEASSRLRVDFEVDQSGIHPISGELTGNLEQNLVRVTDSGGGVLFERAFVQGVFSADLVMTVGEVYTLEAISEGFGAGYGGSWTVSFVPEPGTALLLGLGLAGLASGRRAPQRS